jgi:hypothetical protein
MGEKRIGRPPGRKESRPRRTAARKLLEMAAASGLQPLDVLLTTMRRAWHRAEELEARNAPAETIAEQVEIASVAAIRAAPFVHPRLAAVAVQQASAHVDLSTLSTDERRMLQQLLLRVLGRPVIEGTVSR